MITPKIIKQTVEAFSDIHDLAEKNRTRFVVDHRFLYYKLCKMFIPNISLERIGKAVNRNHATVINGLEQFESLFNTHDFAANRTFNLCVDSLRKNTDEKTLEELYSVYEVKQHFKFKHKKLVEKSHRVINKMRRKLDLLSSHRFVKKVLELSDEELDELEFRFNNYFLVKEQMRKNKEKVKINT